MLRTNLCWPSKNSGKSNEIKAIPELLKLLDLRGCLVTIDAMGCQKEIAKQIVNKYVDYLLAVKGNHEKLEQTISKTFNSSMINDYDGDKYCIQERGHGRTETRLALVCHDTSLLGDIAYDWAELKTIGMVASIRQEGDKPAESMSIRYYISSAHLGAQELLEARSVSCALEYRSPNALAFGHGHE